MIRKCTLPSILLSVLFLFPFSVLAATSSVRAVSRSRYSRAHSLGDSYVFDPRDGWQSVNATNLQYKYPRDTRFDTVTSNPMELAKRNDKTNMDGVIYNVFEGIKAIGKAIGKAQTVKITWYIDLTICEMLFVR
jgi:hypothetical protein